MLTSTTWFLSNEHDTFKSHIGTVYIYTHALQDSQTKGHDHHIVNLSYIVYNQKSYRDIGQQHSNNQEWNRPNQLSGQYRSSKKCTETV